jgi:hypothetical protein
MTSELLLHAMLGLMWAALVLLTWITWRHQQYSRHECCWTAVPVTDADDDEEAWAAVTEAFRDGQCLTSDTSLVTGNRVVACVICGCPVGVTSEEAADEWRCGGCNPFGVPIRAGWIDREFWPRRAS